MGVIYYLRHPVRPEFYELGKAWWEFRPADFARKRVLAVLIEKRHGTTEAIAQRLAVRVRHWLASEQAPEIHSDTEDYWPGPELRKTGEVYDVAGDPSTPSCTGPTCADCGVCLACDGNDECPVSGRHVAGGA